MAGLSDTLRAHSNAIDAVVSEFTDKLQGMLDRATDKLLAELKAKLAISGGLVDSVPKNQSVISSMDTRFMELLNAEGYDGLLEKYVESFNGQFKWFDEVLSDISGELVWPLPPVTFGKADLAEFSAYQAGSQGLLVDAVEKVAARAKLQAVLSSGGMPVKQLTNHIADTLGTSMSESENLAETSISSFYRTITDKGFQLIEDDLPGFNIRYNYEGPLDKLNRPFCTKMERLSRAGKTWTREEIGNMSNGQLPNVFVTGGGYRCRHQWVISTKSLKGQQRGKDRPDSVPKKSTRAGVAKEIEARRAVHTKRFKAQTGADHPAEQIAQIRAGVEAKIKEMRARG